LLTVIITAPSDEHASGHDFFTFNSFLTIYYEGNWVWVWENKRFFQRMYFPQMNDDDKRPKEASQAQPNKGGASRTKGKGKICGK
jgi:hypothetical protein